MPETTIALPGRENLVEADHQPGDLFRLREGWVLRGGQTSDGRRQITAIYLPGDLCDPHWLHRRASQSYWTSSSAVLTSLPIAEARARADIDSDFANEVARAAAVQEARIARWAVNLAQRSASERVALLFCEIAWRLGRDLASNAPWRCPWLLERECFADCVGLTEDHTFRIAREFKLLGLASVTRKRLEIADFARLARVADFEPSYLQ